MSPWSAAGVPSDEWQEATVRQNPARASRDYPGAACHSPSASSGCPTSASRPCSTPSPATTCSPRTTRSRRSSPTSAWCRCPTRASTKLARDVRLRADRARDGLVRRHRGHRQGRVRGCGAGQQVPRQHPRGRRDLPGRARVRRPRRRARRGPDRPGRGHRDDLDRADPRRPPDAGEGRPAPGEGGAHAEGPAARVLEAAQAAAARSWTRAGRCSRRASTGRRCGSCRCSPRSRSSTCSTPTRACSPTRRGARSSPSWSRPRDAVFLDAKVEAELLELDEESAAELLESIGQHEPGLRRAGPRRLPHPGPADLPHGGPEGVPRVDDPAAATPPPRPPA